MGRIKRSDTPKKHYFATYLTFQTADRLRNSAIYANLKIVDVVEKAINLYLDQLAAAGVAGIQEATTGGGGPIIPELEAKVMTRDKALKLWNAEIAKLRAEGLIGVDAIMNAALNRIPEKARKYVIQVLDPTAETEEGC